MPDSKPTRVRYLVLVWFCALAALAYVHRNALSVPSKQVAADLGIEADDMDTILAMFLWGYAAMQIPGGWFGWRWGSRIVVPVLIIVWCGAQGAMGLALGAWFLIGCRFLMGTAQAGLFPCAVQSFARWFPAGERAMPSGFLAACMSIGGALSFVVTGFLLEYFDWQAVMLMLGLPFVICALPFYVWFRDRPAEHRAVSAAEVELIAGGVAQSSADAAAAPEQQIPWYEVVLTPAVFWVCLQQFCRAAAYIFFATWWPRLLQEAYGLEQSQSGYVGSLPLWGVVIGSALGGQLTDWVYRRTGSLAWSRRGVAVFCLVNSSAFMALAFVGDDLWLTVICATFSSVFAGACGPAGYTVTIDLGGRHVATVFSLMNMAGNIAAAIMTTAAIHVKNQGSWDAVLMLVAGLYLLAAGAWLLVRIPKRPAA